MHAEFGASPLCLPPVLDFTPKFLAPVVALTLSSDMILNRIFLLSLSDISLLV